MTDLTFADDANPDEINGLINFGKYELMYNIIEEIQQYQQISYTFEYVDHIASFLCELPQNSDKDMFELSKQAEPKGILSTNTSFYKVLYRLIIKMHQVSFLTFFPHLFCTTGALKSEIL